MRRKEKKERKQKNNGNFFRRHKKLVIFFSIVLVLTIAVAALIGNAQKNLAAGDTSLVTDQATIMDIENSISSDGKIAPAMEENLAPHTGYVLKEVVAETGQALNEGDPILTYTNGKTLTAPYPCVVEKFNLPEAKQSLTADHYVKIGSTDTLMMSMTVNENDFDNIQIGQTAQIIANATGNTYEGQITFISDLADYADTGSTFDVTVTFENDGSLHVGMSATAKVVMKKAEGVVAVPIEAIQEGDNGSYVSVVQDNGETAETPVETGISDGTYIEIKSGLTGDETIQYYISNDEDEYYGY